MTTYNVLLNAIQHKKQVTCFYKGYYREICPHVIGTKHDKLRVLSYQFGGTSSSGLSMGGEWRCMEVRRISDAKVHVGEWHTNPKHTQPQSCVDEVYTEVSY